MKPSRNPPVVTCRGRCPTVSFCSDMGSCRSGCTNPKLPPCDPDASKKKGARKRRLAKVAAMERRIESAILTLKSLRSSNRPLTDRMAGEDMAALYCLARFARQAP